MTALREHRHLRPFVFSNADGTMLSPRQCEHGIHRACRRAGLRLVGWHALRHSYVSRLRAAGAPDAVVQSLVGHGARAMLDLYTHMGPSDRRGAVALLDEPRQRGGNGGEGETTTAP